MNFNNPLAAERFVNEISKLIEKTISKSAKFNKYIRGVVTSVNNETANIKLLDSPNEIYNVKIRPGLDIKVDDNIYINTINNSISNFFIDTKTTDLIKMFGLEATLPHTDLIEIFDDYIDWSNSDPNTDGIISTDTIWFKFNNNSVRLTQPDNTARTLYCEKTVTLDLTTWSDSTSSLASDYIVFIVYILDVNKISTDINITFETSSGNYYKYNEAVGNLITGWNYIKAKKEDFVETGTGDWSNINLIKISWDSTINAENYYISFTCIGMGENILKASGTFLSQDSKTITVTNGIVSSIV